MPSSLANMMMIALPILALTYEFATRKERKQQLKKTTANSTKNMSHGSNFDSTGTRENVPQNKKDNGRDHTLVAVDGDAYEATLDGDANEVVKRRSVVADRSQSNRVSATANINEDDDMRLMSLGELYKRDPEMALRAFERCYPVSKQFLGALADHANPFHPMHQRQRESIQAAFEQDYLTYLESTRTEVSTYYMVTQALSDHNWRPNMLTRTQWKLTHRWMMEQTGNVQKTGWRGREYCTLSSIR